MNEKICPICKIRKVFSVKQRVKEGKTIEYAPGKYSFKQTGWKTVTKEYWTCKKCADTPPSKGGLTAKEYNDKLIEHFKTKVD